jgi:hypothetical protein
VIFLLPSAGAALLAAVGLLVDGRPSSTLSLVVGDASLLVAFFDVLSLALLLVRVAGFIAARHVGLLGRDAFKGE